MDSFLSCIFKSIPIPKARKIWKIGGSKEFILMKKQTVDNL